MLKTMRRKEDLLLFGIGLTSHQRVGGGGGRGRRADCGEADFGEAGSMRRPKQMPSQPLSHN